MLSFNITQDSYQVIAHTRLSVIGYKTNPTQANITYPTAMNQWMNRYMNEELINQIYEWINEPVNKSKNESINQRMNE